MNSRIPRWVADLGVDARDLIAIWEFFGEVGAMREEKIGMVVVDSSGESYL